MHRSMLALAACALLFGCGGPLDEAEATPESVGLEEAARNEALAQELVTATPSTSGLHSERRGIGLSARAVQGAVPTTQLPTDPRRSLAVTEQAIVGTFTLKQVMDQLVAQSGVSGLTSLQLYRQLWDTQNKKPGQGLGAHCDDVVDGTGNPTFNGFPHLCRPAEGSQVGTDPFTNPASPDAYMAVGLFNRFDLAPVDGADCGEYRIVFAKRSGASSASNRNFIIFEASLPNPFPARGLEGCLAVARFWKDLSANNDVAARASSLRQFYFQGLPGFRPVVHIDNYGAEARGTGQIRTNMFMQSNWMLREFKLRKTCSGTTCTALKAVPVTDKVNPFGGLFSPSSTHALAADFRAFLPGQVAALAVADLNLFNYEVPDRFNGGQSQAQGSENNYSTQFAAGGTLRTALQTELTRIGSTLTPDHIVQRAKALSCAGCHELSNNANVGLPQTWPRSLGFTHTSETTEAGPEGTRFLLSPALVNVFLPHRAAVLDEFMARPHACLTQGCVAAGFSHSLAVRPDGTVWAAGSNSTGSLGNGATTPSATPVPVSGLTGVAAVAAGSGFSLALRKDGTVWAWGENTSGQLGDGTLVRRGTPVQVTGLGNVTAVAAGGAFSLALRADGTVWAWGSNSEGQLGDGTLTSRATPGPVLNLSGVVSIAAGGGHAVALRSDRSVWTWGDNGAGQLGDGTLTLRRTPFAVPGMVDGVSIAAGEEFSLIARADGTAWSWGLMFDSQSPQGGWSGVFIKSPQRVAGLTGVVSVVAGSDRSLALRSDNVLWAWGKNTTGALGTGNRALVTAPVAISSGVGFVALSAGGGHTLGIRTDGTLWAWGDNQFGQRGDGTSFTRTAPTRISSLTGLVAVSTGASHTLAQHSDGTLWAWGNNSNGQLGLGDVRTRTAPVRIPGLTDVGSISAGDSHSLALRYDGTVWAWGHNESGQLGLGSTLQRPTPTQVPGLDGIVAVAAGTYHSLAVRYDGTVWAWGDNWQGQLGLGTITASSTVPKQVPGLSGIVAVSAGAYHSLALHYDGSVRAWGANWDGELGDGTLTPRNTPTRVLGLSDIVSLDAGSFHSLAVRSDGAVWAWGRNFDGELGTGDSSSRATPVPVAGVSGVVTAAAGGSHSMAVRFDGTVWAWGANVYNNPATASIGNSLLPAQASTLTGIQGVASGASFSDAERHSLALGTDGTLWSWGYNTEGQLGLSGATRYALVPVRSALF